jgi:hypothetical protein
MIQVSVRLVRPPKVSSVESPAAVEILDQIDLELEHLDDNADQFLFWD